MLYELLTGSPPLEAETLRRAGYAELQRAIEETEPVRPSDRLSLMSESSPGESLGGIDVRRARKQLRSGLDWIVMKCLDKERDRRYSTTSGLAADLKRFLTHEPLVAGPPTVAGFMIMMGERRPWAVAITAIAATAAIWLFFWQFLKFPLP